MRRVLLIVAAVFMGLCWSAPALAAGQKVDLGVLTVKSQKQADELFSRIKKGEPFELLAKKYSVGPAAGRGGRLGKVPLKRLRSEYRAAIKNLAPNAPSAVVPTEEGFTILMKFTSAPQTAKTAPKVAPKTAAKAASPKSLVPQRAPAPLAPAREPVQYVARSLMASGIEAMQRGEFKEAKAKFQQARSKNPHDQSSLFFSQLAEKADVGHYKKSAVQTFAKGFLVMLEGQIKESQQLFGQASDDDPRLWQAALFDGNMLAELGRVKQAKTVLGKVLAINPSSAGAHVTLGVMAAEADQYEEALKEFRKAVELEPDSAEARYQLGSLLMALGELDQAVPQLKRTIAADPYREEAYNDLGIIQAKKGDLKSAKKNLKKALELNPRFVSAHVNLAQMYVRQDKLNLALDELNKAILVDPAFGAAYANLAAIYMLQKDWPSAIANLDKAVSLEYPVSPALIEAVKPHRSKGAGEAGK